MSGFGTGRSSSPCGSVQAEVRTLNHRYLDTVIHLPRAWSALEEAVREAVRRRIHRGRVEVRVTAQDPEAFQRKVRVQSAILAQYWQQLSQIRQDLGITEPLSLTDLVSLPEVVVVEDLAPEDPRLARAVLEAVDRALDQVEAMRRTEGARLWADIDDRLGRILQAVERLAARSGEAVKVWGERLRARVEALLSTAGLKPPVGSGAMADESWQWRLAQEVALLAERSDIAEELTRLQSHVDQMRALAATPAPGRRMEFLVREMDREAATAASKAPASDMVHAIIEIRADLERIREQVANLE